MRNSLALIVLDISFLVCGYSKLWVCFLYWMNSLPTRRLTKEIILPINYFILFCYSWFVLIYQLMSLYAGLYLHAVTETTLRVDTSRGETLRINVMYSFYILAPFHCHPLPTVRKHSFLFKLFLPASCSFILVYFLTLDLGLPELISYMMTLAF